MITDEQVAEEIARLTRERDRAEQLAQHRGAELEQARRERDEAIAEVEQLRARVATLNKAVSGVADDLDAFYRMRGQVVTLLGLCDGLKRFPDYDPANASVTVHAIEQIFGAPAAADSIPLSDRAVYHLSEQHPECKIGHETEGSS